MRVEGFGFRGLGFGILHTLDPKPWTLPPFNPGGPQPRPSQGKLRAAFDASLFGFRVESWGVRVRPKGYGLKRIASLYQNPEGPSTQIVGF